MKHSASRVCELIILIPVSRLLRDFGPTSRFRHDDAIYPQYSGSRLGGKPQCPRLRRKGVEYL